MPGLMEAEAAQRGALPGPVCAPVDRRGLEWPAGLVAESERVGGALPAQDQARAIESIQGERVQMAVQAARLDPPSYITAELGTRPDGGRGAQVWDRAVSGVERYRQENGVSDPNRALGSQPKHGSAAAKARYNAAERRLSEARRKLGRETAQDRSLGVGRGIGR